MEPEPVAMSLAPGGDFPATSVATATSVKVPTTRTTGVDQQHQLQKGQLQEQRNGRLDEPGMSPEQSSSPPVDMVQASSPPDPTFTSTSPRHNPVSEDVEKFDGKIVYNPDGSAYIIDDPGELSEEDASSGLDLPKQEGSIVDAGREELSAKILPPLASAFYVSRNPALYQALYSQGYPSLMPDKKVPDVPVVHSYRVYTVRSQTSQKSRDGEKTENGKDKFKVPPTDFSSVPIKPILMCFMCRLSFGYVKSFVTHAMSDHGMVLNDEEKEIMSQRNTSAVIQQVGKEKEPLISFLEPVYPAPRHEEGHGRGHRPSPPDDGAASLNSSVPFWKNPTRTSPSRGSHEVQVSSPVSSAGLASETSPGRESVSSRTPETRPAASPCSKSSTSPSPARLYQASEACDTSLADPGTLKRPPSVSPGHLKQGTPVHTTSAHSPSGVPSGNPSPSGMSIGACPEHINGKPNGLECANCDLIMNSSQLGCHIGLMQSRNSCKTLKCPKCNWHYKYQETLEIHMKEKHPENETTCIYCITNQPHPRLSRGESYTCGYKPYRCEVCNYSTTTKGNLSIHMQSDKHLNNMQELQNGGSQLPAQVPESNQLPPQLPPLPPSPHAPGVQKVKQKPTWRCDVCNYETNVARNLRIHMTSEKHTHNMMVLQQNVKHMQQLSALHAQANSGQLDASSLMQIMAMSGEKSTSEATLADMAYSQAVLLQLMTGGSLASHGMDPEMSTPVPPEALEQGDPVEPNPSGMFQCCVCAIFSTDNLEALNQHLSADRSRLPEPDVLVLVAGNYICKLCSYKTNLKANFQLHCKTDKHLQKLQHMSHVREGGPKNDWRLKYLNLTQPVQVRCNACDFYTNSTHKLGLHSQSQAHDVGAMLWWHLRRCEDGVRGEGRLYSCGLCAFTTTVKMQMVKHVRSVKHIQAEQLLQLKRRQEGHDTVAEMADIFFVTSLGDIEEHASDKREGKSSDLDQDGEDSSRLKSALEKENKGSIACPLCQEAASDRAGLEKHLMQIHNVNFDGMQRLLAMVGQSHWLSGQKGSFEDVVMKDDQETSDSELPDELKCQTCHTTYRTVEELASHQTAADHVELKQTPRGPGYLCWKKGCNQYFQNVQALQTHFMEIHAKNQQLAVSERHVYKYRCNQCSLAFKTLEKLQLHSQYHLIRESTSCILCHRSFRSVQALQKHLETAHNDLPEAKLQQYKASLMNNPVVQAGLSGQVLDPAAMELLKKESTKDEECGPDEDEDKPDEENANEDDEDSKSGDDSGGSKQQVLEDYLNSPAVAEDSYNDPSRKYKCHKCKAAFTRQSYLTSHNKTLLHRKGEKLSYPMEKYLDPNRPFKCEICKESFTQKNILLVHYNSVSHLHKLKRAMQEQQSQPGTQTDGSSPPGASMLASIANKELDDDKKPYRCNICRVAYSQGSTLDIHIRSVLHQTRASKIQDLALSGQLDLNKPLIEQPEHHRAQETQKKILQDMLGVGKYTQPLSLETSSQFSPPCTSTAMTTSPTPRSGSAQQSPKSAHSCSRCGAIFGNQEQLTQHQQFSCLFQSPMASLSAVEGTSQMILQQAQRHQGEDHRSSPDKDMLEETPRFTIPVKKSSLVQKQLLRSYGFELVMQFLEYHQKRTAEESLGDRSDEDKSPEGEEAEGRNQNIPELEKSVCRSCGKQFSSIWVARAHAEEIHQDFVPFSTVETFAEEFRKDYDERMVEAGGSEDSDQRPREEEGNPSGGHLLSEAGALMQASGESAISSASGAGNPLYTTATSGMDKKTTISSSASVSPNLFQQQMGDMTAALSAMQQMQLNPMMMASLSLGMGLPFGMNALTAMNLQPPLFPFMMAPPLDPVMTAAMMQQSQNSLVPGAIDPNLLASHQQKLLQQQQHQQQVAGPSKRARTRITDEQLKILRAHFDINNSPSEEQINEMAQQSGLPPKVIKHWFRNTLFKERQRNKDSPYNFSNPPSTTLNLEEYEKTGEAKVTSLARQDEDSSSQKDESGKPPEQKRARISEDPIPSVKIKDAMDDAGGEHSRENKTSSKPTSQSQEEMSAVKLESPKPPSSSSTPSSLTLTSIISSQLNSEMASRAPQFSTPLNPLAPFQVSPHTGGFLPFPPTPPPPTAVKSEISPAHSTPTSSYSSTPTTSNSAGGTGKRANRTRFTDYQIKVLQEFFENNAYPKDDDLEYLSKLLNLSPRVIVVWFQNARQKARKVYENQPPIDPSDEGAGRFQRTPGLNYQCKKCLLVFQRYYELIRHQKSHCFKAEDAKRSAQAQAAAAAVAAGSIPTHSEDSSSSSIADSCNTVTSSQHSQHIPSVKSESQFQCEQCKLVFPRFELWREHQLVHMMNPNLFASHHVGSAGAMTQPEGSTNSSPGPESSSQKRRPEESEDEKDDQHSKRLRTTILPEQLDYLYQKYQVESNPSRKMLENIAREVGLKKRVVQVWFQNTRARERKGQYRAHAHVINKRCPLCPALFKVRSALESHLATKHSEQFARGEINVDSLPDEDSGPETSVPSHIPYSGLLYSNLEQDVKKQYEEALRGYLGDDTSVHSGSHGTDTPLDLSKPGGESMIEEVRIGGLQDETLSVTYSESTDCCDGEEETNPSTSPQPLPQSAKQSSGGGKRFRTQMSSLQVRVMKSIFADYKTPTMAECELLGQEIGLPKRVVQVWFQNARAKEKKNKLALAKTLGSEIEAPPPPEECTFCKVRYSHKYALQDHLFSKRHINALKAASGDEGPKSTSPSTNGPKPGENFPMQGDSEAERFLMQMYGFSMASGSSPSAAVLSHAPFMPPLSGFQPNSLPGLPDAWSRGIPLGLLQLPMTVVAQVSGVLAEPGTSKVAFTQDGKNVTSEPGASEVDLPLAVVCKGCRCAFPTEVQVAGHQCPGRSTGMGMLRILQHFYACCVCQEKFPTAEAYRVHMANEHHRHFQAGGTDSNGNIAKGESADNPRLGGGEVTHRSPPTALRMGQ